MSDIGSGVRSTLISAVIVTLVTQTTFAQQAPAATTVRSVLALTTLPSLVGPPLFFRLSNVELPASQKSHIQEASGSSMFEPARSPSRPRAASEHCNNKKRLSCRPEKLIH